MILARLLLFLGAGPALLAGQTAHVPIVELYTDNHGLYFPAGRTLYAAISDDGQMEYMDTANHDLAVKHRLLSDGELATLRKQIANESLLLSAGNIDADHQPPHADYQTILEVSVRRDGRMQRFILRGFDAEDGRPFPPAVNSFLCVVDDLKSVQYRLSSKCPTTR